MALNGFQALKNIPGSKGLPLFGHFFPLVNNASTFLKARREKYGDVFTLNTPNGPGVMLCGPAANKFLLVEQAKFTGNKEAWESALSDLFPNGLMLMDGDQHKYHRAIMLDAFKKEAMQGYVEEMPAIIDQVLQELEGKEKVLFFPFVKSLTLKLAAKVFFGLELNKDLEDINKAITQVVDAAAALPLKLPFTTYGRGLKARAFLVQYFNSIIEERRSHPGKDLFSKFCQAKDEQGNQFTDQEIIDHLIFVLMASHDTTAITMTMMAYYIAKYPDWQAKLREEVNAFGTFEGIQVKALRGLEKMGLVMKEALRLHPPLIGVMRKNLRDIKIDQHFIPKNTKIHLIFQLTHNDERTWSKPTQFDPERFNSERKEHQKCPYAYAPFGAGPHHCIGYGFAEAQIKLVFSMLIQKFELSVPEDYECKIIDMPLKHPKDDLPILLNQLTVK